MLHIDQLRAEGRAKLDVADLLTDMLEGRVGPRPPLYEKESGISEGPAPNTTTDSTHDHLLGLARNAYEAWRALYRIAMPTGLGDVAEGEWAQADKAMEALAELLYPGFEIIGSGGSLAVPRKLRPGFVPGEDNSPIWVGDGPVPADPYEPDVPADRLTEPHAYLAQYVRGEATGRCAITHCGADSHDPVHNVPAFSPISACTGFVPMAGYGETRCKSCGRPKDPDHPVKVQP